MAMNSRLLRPRATGFNPKSIAGLDGWWDFSDASTLTIDTGISAVADKSGNGYTATQSTGANQPLLTTNALNGLSAADFDGSNDRLSSANVPTEADDFTGFSVFQATGWGGGNFSRIFDRGGGSEMLMYLDDFGGSNKRFNVSRGNSFHSPNGSLSLNEWYLVSGRMAASESPVASLRLGGVNQAMSVLGGSAPSSVAGVPYVLGNRTAGDRGFDGLIGEVLIYRRALTASEVAKCEGYLAWKWGLQAQLPYDHPYARSFPGYGSQTVPTDADTLTYLAAVKAADGTGVEVGVANAVDAFVTGCKSDGIWSAIKASCILMGARTLSGALTPLVGSAPTNNGPFVSGDYNRETGLVGNGTSKYLDSNYAFVGALQNNRHAAVWVSTPQTSGAWAYLGSSALPLGTNARTQIIGISGTETSISTRLSNETTSTSGTANNVAGLIGARRSGSASYVRRAAGADETVTAASVSGDENNVLIFARNVPTFFNHTSGRIAFYSIGESLTLSSLDSRLTTLYNAIGAAIP